MRQYNHKKEESYKANMQLPQLDLVLFTFGNVSAVDRSLGVFAIKPSGVPYEQLKVEDMVIVDFEGTVVEGNLRPSSDSKTHAVLYKHWIDTVSYTHLDVYKRQSECHVRIMERPYLYKRSRGN